MTCSCCGGQGLTDRSVLWPELIREWGLSPEEAAYIDRQQGRHCVRCGHLLEGEPPTCPACGHVHYRDPKVAACAIFRWDGGVFLTRRGIEPGRFAACLRRP